MEEGNALRQRHQRNGQALGSDALTQRQLIRSLDDHLREHRQVIGREGQSGMPSSPSVAACIALMQVA